MARTGDRETDGSDVTFDAGVRRTGDGGREVVRLLPGGDPLAVVTHLPEGPPRGAVLVCSPLGWAFTRDYRREVLLGRRLAGAGLAVQRFHPRGLGESGGSFADTTFGRLVHDALAAADDLEERAEVALTAVVGVRIGALVALAVAGQRGGADVVAWDPVADGRSYVRELIRLRTAWRLAAGGEQPSADEELERTGRLDVVGFPLCRSSLDDLASVRPADLIASGQPPRRALLVHLGRDAGTVPRAVRDLADRLDGAGTQVETEQVEGRFEWWLRHGFEGEESSSVGRGLLDATTRFLTGPGAAGPTSSPAAAPASRSAPPLAAGQAAAAPAARVQPVFLPAAGDQSLFGVLVEPERRRSDAAVVLLSGGDYQLTAGPFGVWAQVGERLAAAGVASLRFSYQGVGDSTGSVDDFDLRQPATGDLDAARRFLAERGVDRVVLVGRCFGARTACAAPTDGVAGLALVSLSLRAESLRHSAGGRPQRVTPAPAGAVVRRLARRDVLRLLADPARRRRALRRLRLSAGHAVARRRGPAAADAMLDWLNTDLILDIERHATAGVPVLAIHGRGERGEFEAARGGRLGRLLRSGGVREHVLDDANALYAPGATADAVVAHVTAVLGLAPGST